MGGRSSHLRHSRKRSTTVSTASTNTTTDFDVENPAYARKSRDLKHGEQPTALEVKRRMILDGLRTAMKETNVHNYFKCFVNGNFNAPVNDVLLAGDAKVLEVGCANSNGIWTIDMAQDYPLSFFVGVDPILPADISQRCLPRNVRFDSANLFFLPYEDDEFDFVYVSMMSVVLSGNSLAWNKLIRELARVTKPEGYVEIIDPEFGIKSCGPLLDQFQRALEQEVNFPEDLSNFKSHEKRLDTEQFRDVKWGYLSVQLGSPGEAGTNILDTMRLFMMSFAPILSRSLGLVKRFDKREYELFVVSCIQESVEFEAFLDLYYTYAVKT